MPAELVHLSISAGVADALTLAQALKPAFILGSVATDVNNLLGWPRQETHFWAGPEGDGVSGAFKLLAAYPELNACHLTPSEQAFVAGYLSHMITDEQEILTLSRPHIARLGGGEWRLPSLIVLDAAVEEADPSRLRTGIASLRDAGHLRLREGLLPFVSMADVQMWAKRTLAVTDLLPSRARVQPHRPGAQNELTAEAGQQLVTRMAELRRAVPPAAIREFVERSVSESVVCIAAYLAGQPLPTPRGTTAPHTLTPVQR